MGWVAVLTVIKMCTNSLKLKVNQYISGGSYCDMSYIVFPNYSSEIPYKYDIWCKKVGSF